MVTERHAVAYVLRSFPRLTQTFILNEVLALEQLGVPLEIFSIVDPGEAIRQSGVAHVRGPVRYLQRPPAGRLAGILSDHLVMLRRRPRRYLATTRYLLLRRDLDDGYTTATRWSCFDYAVRLSRRISERPSVAPRITHVHSHFAHDPTLVALLTKRLTGVPFSFTAHARDLYQTRPASLSERIRESTSVVTCCAANLAYLAGAAPARDLAKLRLIHHGLDSSLFGRADPPPAIPATPLIVSAGRLVEKKGFFDLVGACALLRDTGHDFRCVIFGDGPLREPLLEHVAGLRLNGHVRLAGVCTQDQLSTELRRATVFALTPITTADGDRDGIPNVLVEAMASRLPVVSTDAGGISELVVHGATGLLSHPGDAAAIARNLAALLGDQELRDRLSAAGRRAVDDNFDIHANAALLAGVLELQELTR
jgi:glycosyltransferase involved in cell wall biosynthesis